MRASPELIDALRRVTRGANPEWSSFVLVVIQMCALRHSHFSTDEVHSVLDVLGDDAPTTPEKRALGPVMLLAQKNGWIAPSTLPAVRSERKDNHGRWLTVWDSKLYHTGDARAEMLAAIAALERGQ